MPEACHGDKSSPFCLANRPGLLLFLYSRRQLGADLRLSGRERWLAGVTLLSLIPAVWSFAHL